MENNNNNNTIDTTTEGSVQATQTGGNNTDPNTSSAEETVTMSKADFDKAIQAAEDRLRTKYSKDIKALEAKVIELTPVVKTEAELAIEQRLADLERKEKENAAKEKNLSIRASLQLHNIDAGIADYLNPDADIEAFNADIEKVFTARMAADGYKPSGHQTNQPVTRDEYDKMSYDEKAELYRRDPESWKRLKN